jgi:hypothetical protein
MKSYKIWIFVLSAWMTTNLLLAQNDLASVLAAVERNNKTLATQRQYWEGKKLEYKTGLSLPNPTVQGQYLIGSPAAAGNQTDFFAVQPFDFPSTYKKKRQLAEMQAQQSGNSLAQTRQTVLLEAKLSCIEITYRNKLRVHLARRKASLEAMARDFQTKLDRGEGNMLNVNKARLQLLEVNQLIQENEMALQALSTLLIGLNGGVALVFTDSIYPASPSNLSFDALEQANEAADPLLKALQQERDITEKQVELSSVSTGFTPGWFCRFGSISTVLNSTGLSFSSTTCNSWITATSIFTPSKGCMSSGWAYRLLWSNTTVFWPKCKVYRCWIKLWLWEKYLPWTTSWRSICTRMPGCPTSKRSGNTRLYWQNCSNIRYKICVAVLWIYPSLPCNQGPRNPLARR